MNQITDSFHIDFYLEVMIIIVTPFLANFLAIHNPRPLVPPVTTAIFPSRENDTRFVAWIF